MIFTNRNILIALVIAVGLILYFSLPMVSIANRVIIGLIVIGVIITTATHKIDNQPLVSLIPRMVRYIFRNKQHRL
jgi:hypothetical protein